MQVYSEVSIFEEIALYPGKYPNWSVILNKHAEVCLNISQAELNAQLVEGEVLFEYVKAAEGKEPVALDSYFAALYADPDEMLVHPRAAFLLKHDGKEAARLTAEYGLVVQSAESLDDAVLVSPALFMDLPKDRVFEAGGKKGWHVLMAVDLPPSNSMVIVDPYVLTSSNGLSNLKQLCDAVLPASLKVAYHIAVICSHVNNSSPKSETWRTQEAGKIIAAIRKLRSYDIDVEVVFEDAEDYHRRRVVFNYANLTCDKGFAVFKTADGKTVATVNDTSFKRAFHDPTIVGDSQYTSGTTDLETVKRRTNNLAAHITSKIALDKGSICGACNPDKTLKNRLINDVVLGPTSKIVEPDQPARHP
ncbi:MAG: hypothetical protein KJZ58_13660 [Flavobacteriales bacterium]|nr:hypothetical protein [Flavobacteriales bacterium]